MTHVSPADDQIERLEKSIDWVKLSKAVKKNLDDIVYDICADVQFHVEQQMSNNAAWDVVSEATKAAAEAIGKALHGDEEAFKRLIGHSDYYASSVSRYPKIELSTSAQLRRALLVEHRDLFEKIVIADYDALETELRTEIARQHAAYERQREWIKENCP